MPITATELKLNLGLYLNESQNNDIFISKNGTIIAKLIGINSYKSKKNISKFKELGGIIHSADSFNDIREERTSKIMSEILHKIL